MAGEPQDRSFAQSIREDTIALRMELGQLLVRAKLITVEQMNDALKRQSGKAGASETIWLPWAT